MQLFFIPDVSDIVYTGGFTKTNAETERLIDDSLNEEAYSITVNEKIVIRANSDAGFFYADKTMEQLRFQCGRNLPNVEIKDAPRYRYRSFMIDACRHFVPVPYIKRMIEHCAKLKFNVFHWHLTDDQGWRAEIKAFPELIQTGSKRYGNHFGREQNDKIHAGFYTQTQMKEIVDFAHAHHMTVVPEIDMPGHTSALLHAIEGLACDGKRVEIKTTPGIFKDILCAGREETYSALFQILDEICDIFPDDYIHIGGDEAPKTQWKTCPDCQKRMQDELLANEEALQGYFINRINAYLQEKGKKVITWNESLNSGILNRDITVQMWMDPKKRSVHSPNNIINSDFYHLYADYPYAMTPLKKVYRYEPQINGNVIGLDIPIWTEYIININKMEYMCFPRFTAAAQSAWCKNKPPYRSYLDALKELETYFAVKNAAKSNEWDPHLLSRLPKVIQHFGSIHPNERIRKWFIKQ